MCQETGSEFIFILILYIFTKEKHKVNLFSSSYGNIKKNSHQV